jgi:hypothetical protein
LKGGQKRDIIETLREMLDMAEAGELICVGVVWARETDDPEGFEFNNTWAADTDYTHSFVTLLSAFEVAKFELMQEN